MASDSIYFTFVGTPRFIKGRDLVREVDMKRGGETIKALSMAFCVTDGTNSITVEAFDAPTDSILTYDRDKNKIEIAWDDRLDEDYVRNVAFYRLNTVNLDGESHDFISKYDMMQYLAETLPSYTGKIMVRGSFSMRQNKKDKTKIRPNYTVNGVYAVDDDEKPRFSMIDDLYYNKSSFDKSDVKNSGKMFLNSYLPMWINRDEGTKFIPFPTVFNAAAYDLENDHQKKLYDSKMEFLDIKQKNMMHLTWELRCVNGSEEIPFDESQLTNLQRRQIALGEATLEDYRPRRSTLGATVTEFRLLKPIFKGEFADGMVDTGMTEREFEDELYSPVQDEDETVLENPVENPKKTVEETPDDDIF